MKHNANKLLCMTLALTLLFSSLFALGASAAGNDTVRVVVKNNTFTAQGGAPWTGVLIDRKMELTAEDSMESVLERAVQSSGFAFTVSEYGYISSVNGLSEYAANGSGGWMATLNDWFTADATTAYTVANGALTAGDELVMQYTCSWGADVGSLYGNYDTSLNSLKIDGASLSAPFDPAVIEYDVYIGTEEKEITLYPEAANKNYQVRSYLNEFRATDESAYLRRGRAFKVTDGDSFYIGIGNPAWPSMNAYGGVAEQTVYYFNVKYRAVKGDLDGNGVLDINDVTKLQRCLAEFEALSNKQLAAADVTGDGRVDINDATKMQRIIAELE